MRLSKVISSSIGASPDYPYLLNLSCGHKTVRNQTPNSNPPKRVRCLECTEDGFKIRCPSCTRKFPQVEGKEEILFTEVKRGHIMVSLFSGSVPLCQVGLPLESTEEVTA